MQKKTFNTLNRKRHLRINKRLRYLFVPMLVLIFSLQQFSSFAYSQIKDSRRPANLVKVQSDKLLVSADVAADLPFDSPPHEPEAEVIEEEETKSHTGKYWTPHTYKHSSPDVFFTLSLNSRFLQIVCSLHSRLSIPFFILHHSWKSFLS